VVVKGALLSYLIGVPRDEGDTFFGPRLLLELNLIRSSHVLLGESKGKV